MAKVMPAKHRHLTSSEPKRSRARAAQAWRRRCSGSDPHRTRGGRASARRAALAVAIYLTVTLGALC